MALSIIQWILKVKGLIFGVGLRLPLLRYPDQVDESRGIPIESLLRRYPNTSEDYIDSNPRRSDLAILFIFPRGPQSDLSVDPDSAKAQVGILDVF